MTKDKADGKYRYTVTFGKTRMHSHEGMGKVASETANKSTLSAGPGPGDLYLVQRKAYDPASIDVVKKKTKKDKNERKASEDLSDNDIARKKKNANTDPDDSKFSISDLGFSSVEEC